MNAEMTQEDYTFQTHTEADFDPEHDTDRHCYHPPVPAGVCYKVRRQTPASETKITLINEICCYFSRLQETVSAAARQPSRNVNKYERICFNLPERLAVQRYGMNLDRYCAVHQRAGQDYARDIAWLIRESQARTIRGVGYDMENRVEALFFVAATKEIVQEMIKKNQRWLEGAEGGWRSVRVMIDLARSLDVL